RASNFSVPVGGLQPPVLVRSPVRCHRADSICGDRLQVHGECGSAAGLESLLESWQPILPLSVFARTCSRFARCAAWRSSAILLAAVAVAATAARCTARSFPDR